jgi:ABC-2 type transport system ATP-binding protein
MRGKEMNNEKKIAAVTIRDLVKKFGRFTAVDRLSFEVTKGEIFGFLGPNGAGKSTTIRMLTGILAPTSGGGTVAGFDVASQPEAIKTRIGYMSQRFSLYEDLTVEENINFYSGIYRIPKAKKPERKEWVIEMAGLKDHRRMVMKYLSGGWKQRLAFGCAILHEPPIIFLDEPTSGVDPISRREFWDRIYELAEEGTTIFVTTHYMDEAEYCDRLGMIYRGELIATGSPQELKDHFMAEDVLEIACEKPQESLGVIENIGSVREAAIFGNTIHVATSKTSEAKNEIVHRLVKNNIHLVSIEKIQPSLEDVFVSLIEAHDRKAGKQEEVAG